MAKAPKYRRIRLLTSLAGHDEEGRPFAWAPGDVRDVPAHVAEALASDGERAVLLDDDGKDLPVPEDRKVENRGRETATDKRARSRETAQPPSAATDAGPTGNEVATRQQRERLEQLADGDPVAEADAQARAARRTGRPRRAAQTLDPSAQA